MSQFTCLENAALWKRATWWIRYIATWFSRSRLSPYVTWQRRTLPEVGYLLIEHVEEGRMLSDGWEEHRHDPVRRANLFRSLSRIQLALLQHPLPYIGSWTIDNFGYLKLGNRPLTLLLHELENQGISTGIPRDLVYTSIESYYLDLLACHDNRLSYQSNSIRDQEDGEQQLAAVVGMRALLDKFTDRRCYGAPFVLSLTDLHRSNIFVDDEWNITRIIDLEWACSRPTQMCNVPYWLTNRGLDELDGDDLDEFEIIFDEFIRVCQAEEGKCGQGNLSQILQTNWDLCRYWYTQALDCPSALLLIFVVHIQIKFGVFDAESDKTLMKYWSRGAPEFIARKIEETAEYGNKIRGMFAAVAVDAKAMVSPTVASRLKQ